MKKTLSFILAALMVLSCFALAACSGNDGDGATTTGGGSDAATTTGGDTIGSDETEAPDLNENGLPSEFFENYTPDEGAKYQGKAGLSGTGVMFDKLTLRSGRETIYENTFDSNLGISEGVYSVYGGALSDWAIGDDTINAGNKILKYNGSDSSILTLGNDKWTKYRCNVSVALEENGVAELYFCVKDEKNYFKLTVGADAATGMKFTETTDGTEKPIRQLNIKTAPGTWVPLSVDIDVDTIIVYLNGVEIFECNDNAAAVPIEGRVGFSQWNTDVYFDNVTIEDLMTNETIWTIDFEDESVMDSATFGNRNGGSWTNTENQEGEWEITDSPTGDGKALHFGNTGVYGATITFDPEIPEGTEAMKITAHGYRAGGSGAYEAWPVLWNWIDAENYRCCNIGGWSGCAAFQTITGGVKTNHDACTDPIGIVDGTWQTLEIYIYPEVAYAVFEGNLILTLWF